MKTTTKTIAKATSRDGALDICINRVGGDESTDGEIWFNVSVSAVGESRVLLARTFFYDRGVDAEREARDFGNVMWADGNDDNFPEACNAYAESHVLAYA